jgi:hypothetical protein
MKKQGYKNRHGKVTSIEEDSIHIDGDLFLADRSYSRERVERANLSVGDEVEFNFNEKTGEIIYLQNKTTFKNRCIEDHMRYYGSAQEFPFGGSGEMANLFLSSHDPMDEFESGGWM